jgi:hypothetical protein
MNITELFLRHNLVSFEANEFATTVTEKILDSTIVATFVSNLATYGYAFSKDALARFATLTKGQQTLLWTKLEPNLKTITGADRNMDNFVVYKNFPKEVLDMSQSEYWVKQILMYMGFHKSNFTQEELARPTIFEERQLKVIHLAGETALADIYADLVKNTSKWTDNQKEAFDTIVFNWGSSTGRSIDSDEFGFKENLMHALTLVITNGLNYKFTIKDATDVMRLCAALSESDASLRTKVKFKKFSRSHRRIILTMLSGAKNLEADVAMRADLWKKLFAQLHPGEYRQFRKISEVYNKLYNDEVKSFASQLELAVNKDVWNGEGDKVFTLLETRPGEFFRALHRMYGIFGIEAFKSFGKVVPSLTTLQLIKIKKYLLTINDRKTLAIAPKGNWTKMQVLVNEKTKIDRKDLAFVLKLVTSELKDRLNTLFPNGVNLDARTAQIKLATNDQELAEYGRGTSFDIPENITFLRSASYWQSNPHETTWYDNGWNFFDDNWKAIGSCCWNEVTFRNSTAFSGDPVNSRELKGRACQMIDLYMDKLADDGIRYAVWNILCYSKRSFSQAEEVLATLQMGENAETGKLYEPSRAQMVFPLKGDNMSKYVAYIDVKERKLVYIDANLYGDVSSAENNQGILQEKMPAFIEYLDSLPSVGDLMIHAKSGATPILYDDKDVTIDSGEAYVFRPLNTANKFEPLSMTKVLG